jgi:hypothetical protein
MNRQVNLAFTALAVLTASCNNHMICPTDHIIADIKGRSEQMGLSLHVNR